MGRKTPRRRIFSEHYLLGAPILSKRFSRFPPRHQVQHRIFVMLRATFSQKPHLPCRCWARHRGKPDRMLLRPQQSPQYSSESRKRARGVCCQWYSYSPVKERVDNKPAIYKEYRSPQGSGKRGIWVFELRRPVRDAVRSVMPHLGVRVGGCCSRVWPEGCPGWLRR